MDDLHERFQQIERNPSPDLWEEVTDRAVGSVPRTATQHGWRRVAIIAASLAIGLAAVAWVVIAIRPTTSPPVAVDQSFAWPDNSCGLVTNADVEAATHSKVTQSGLLTDDQLIFPEGPNPCQYKTDDEHTSLTVFASPDDIDELFNKARDRDPANVVMLPDLGDEAFSHALADVWVRVGSGYFVISSQHGAGGEGVAELEALARLALGSRDATLLVSSSGPSGGQAVAGGTLTSQNGCLTVSGYDSPLYVVWPNGYSLAEEGDHVWLVDDSGNRIARIGDYVLMDGESRDLAHTESEVVGGIPPSCEVVGGPDPYWFAGTPELVEPQPCSEVGVNDPAIEQISLVQDRIASVEEELVSLDTTTAEGGALESLLNEQLQALHDVLRDLYEAGQPDPCS